MGLKSGFFPRKTAELDGAGPGNREKEMGTFLNCPLGRAKGDAPAASASPFASN
jgi:hypothetical protein